MCRNLYMMIRNITQTLAISVIAATIASFAGPVAMAQSRSDTAELDAVEKRLIEHYNMREGSVAMRDLAEWAPLKKIVVRDIYGPGSLGTTEARIEWISKVAPGVEFVVVETLQEAIDGRTPAGCAGGDRHRLQPGFHFCFWSGSSLDTVQQQRSRALLLR